MVRAELDNILPLREAFRWALVAYLLVAFAL